jgi:hypothetical protein
MTDADVVDRGPRVCVEPWPSGGWAVRLAGHEVPISRHDSEDEAHAKADAYSRGLRAARYDAS